MRIRPVVNEYTLKKTPGFVSGVTVDGLAFSGTPIPLRFLVRGVDASHIARDVSISNVTVNGERMTDQSPARPASYLGGDIRFDDGRRLDRSSPMFVRGPHVGNVRFDSERGENRACAVPPKGTNGGGGVMAQMKGKSGGMP